MASRRPGPGELLVGASGFLLLLVMFLPWFGLDGRVRVPNIGVISIGAQNLNAWEAFGAIDIVLAFVAALAIALAAVAFYAEPPPALVLAVIAGAGLAALLVLFRLIDVPDIQIEAPGDASYEVGRRLGAFFGLLCTAGMTWGANLVGAAAPAPAREKPARRAEPETPVREAPAPARDEAPAPAHAAPAPAREAPTPAREVPAPPPEPAREEPALPPEPAREEPALPPEPARAPAPRPARSRRGAAPEPAAAALAAWSREAIDAACQPAWRRYDRRLGARYERYFEDHPELAGEQRISARDYASALPPGWDELVDEVPDDARHRQHLSGKSSQTLAVGLLGVAARTDPSLGWLWDALGPLPDAGSETRRIEFEHRVSAELLGERPRQTSIDVLVDDPEVVIAIESKWREHGIASCLCRGDGVGPAPGLRCSGRVEQRAPYWDAAATMGLGDREPGAGCPISPSYQAIRNCAAVRALAGPERLAVFALVYDAQNPYFADTDEWPGWPRLLDEAVSAHADLEDLRFAAISWQELVPLLPLDEPTRAWAADKHGLD
jgi:outer membrane biosynthesis protein TonB